MRQIIYIFTILALIVCSCDKIKSKGKELADKSTEKVKDISGDLAAKVIPKFDAYKPDTKYNKERFKEFLQIDLTEDINNIYCFGDFIGIDSGYQFSFNCDSSTAERIIEKHHLTLNNENTDFAFGLQSDFKWWNKKKIEKLKLYSWEGEHRYYKYFWYDKNEHKAYYFDFDM